MFLTIITFSILIIGVLGLGSLSGLFSERIGIINIAINGMMIIGAIIYAYFSKFIQKPGMQFILLIITALFGGLFALLHGVATIKLNANHIISGVALNLLAPAIALFIMKFNGDSNKIQVFLRDLSLIKAGSSEKSYKSLISLSFFLTITIFFISWFVINKTKWGLRMKSIGENPNAANSLGINVNLMKYQGIFISGMLAALAGAMFVQNFGFFSGNVQGMGFLALAILIMGQWRVPLAFIAAIGFTFVYSTAYVFSSSIEGGIFAKIKEYSDLIHTVPFVLTLIALSFLSKRSLAPKAIGKHFNKSKK